MIRVIVAMDEKRGLADDNDIPWNLPSDKRYFRAKTEHGIMLMGYGTYVKFAQPLPNRRNVVASTSSDELRPGFELVSDARAFLTQTQEDVWVIGGAGLIATTIDLANELYITQVQGDFNCTKFFPEYEKDFERISASEKMVENNIPFWYEVWKRRV